jgi:hypothetical protein
MNREAAATRFTTAPTNSVATPAATEEGLVADARAGVTSAQMIERRLVFLLQGTPLPRGSRQPFAPRRDLSYEGACGQGARTEPEPVTS